MIRLFALSVALFLAACSPYVEGGYSYWPDTSNDDEVEADSSGGAVLGAGLLHEEEHWAIGGGAGYRYNRTHGENLDGKFRNNDGPGHVAWPYAEGRVGLPLGGNWSVEVLGRAGPVWIKLLSDSDFTYGLEGGLGLRYQFEDWSLGLSGRYFRAGCTDHKGAEACFDSFGPVLDLRF